MENKEITEKIIGAAYKVYNTMRFGFLESVYEKCLCIELEQSGLTVECQKKIDVYYHKVLVGVFIADLVVNNTVIVEMKSVRQIVPAHEAQLVNYLTATGIDVGLILNFGEQHLDVKRKVRIIEQGVNF